jgi:hypothetical protein
VRLWHWCCEEVNAMRLHILFFGLVALFLSSCAQNCANTPGYTNGYNGQCVPYGSTGVYGGTTYSGVYGAQYGTTYGGATYGTPYAGGVYGTTYH